MHEIDAVGYIISDLDGALSLDHPRRHLIKQSWEGYFDQIINDRCNAAVQTFLLAMARTHATYIITSRPEKYRQVTEQWLARHGVMYEKLLMRPMKHTATGNEAWQEHMSDADLKHQHLKDHGLYPGNVLCVIEDRDEMVAFYRGLGFDCWQVHSEGASFKPD